MMGLGTLECKSADYNEAREVYIEKMLAEGFIISYPAENELQIDIDSEEGGLEHERLWDCFRSNLGADFSTIITPSRSGYPNRHVRIKLPFNIDPWQRIALQAALGSDPVREMLSAIRLMKGDKHPTLLIEDPNVYRISENCSA